MVRDLAEVFLWVGFAGAGIAVICAIAALIALAVGSAAVAGGAAAVWIGGALLSLTSGYSGQWIPIIVAGGALVVALVLGGVARSMVMLVQARPQTANAVRFDDAVRLERAAQLETVARQEKPERAAASASTAKPRIVGVRAVASESIR